MAAVDGRVARLALADVRKVLAARNRIDGGAVSGAAASLMNQRTGAAIAVVPRAFFTGGKVRR